MSEPVFEKGYPSFEAVNSNTGVEDSTSKIFTFVSTPKYAWKCELHPSVYWHVEEGKQPNVFNRLMQRLCFGVKWSKIDG